MADEPAVGYQRLHLLVAHGAHLAWLEAAERLLEGRPLGVHHVVPEPRAENAQRHQREVAVVGDLSEGRRRFHVGQPALELGLAEALLGGLLDLGELDHALRPMSFDTRPRGARSGRGGEWMIRALLTRTLVQLS